MTTTADNHNRARQGDRHDELADRFTRVFGRQPTDAELARFRSARTGLQLRLPAQARRAAASLLANL